LAGATAGGEGLGFLLGHGASIKGSSVSLSRLPSTQKRGSGAALERRTGFDYCFIARVACMSWSVVVMILEFAS